MPSPFPGMNPYLENPELWPEVHSRLIVTLADSLNPQLIPKYRAAIERRVYTLDGSDSLLVGIPDVTVKRRKGSGTSQSNVAVMALPSSPVKVQVPMPIEIRESYLHIKEIATGEVIAAVEVLSPTNKRVGKGRSAYEEKRRDVLSSRTHLIEIDLLRNGEAMTVLAGGLKSDYRVLVSRSEQRPQADLYAFNLTDEMPSFPIPLQVEDKDLVVDLFSLIDQVYERAGYEVVIDYDKPPVPPLGGDSAAWMDELLKEKGLRAKG